jgi:hypothetical protein
MAVSRKESCGRRSPSACVVFDAVADNYGFTEAMRAAGWQTSRQTEVTGPMYQSRSDCVRVAAGFSPRKNGHKGCASLSDA